MRGWVTSSLGFRVRIAGPGLPYEDSKGLLRVDPEAMSGPGMTVVLYRHSVPDDDKRSSQQIIDNIRRAFEFAGWSLIRPGLT